MFFFAALLVIDSMIIIVDFLTVWKTRVLVKCRIAECGK